MKREEMNFRGRSRITCTIMRSLLTLTLPFFCHYLAAQDTEFRRHCTIDAATEADKAFKPRESSILRESDPLEPDQSMVQFDRFGGTLSAGRRASRFFRTEKIGDRWWLVTPEGGLSINRSVNSVTLPRSKRGLAAIQKRFGGVEQWEVETAQVLKNHGFNGTGAWSDTTGMSGETSGLAYCKLWNFMSAYGKQRGGTHQEAGHTGYPDDCPFIFDPEFVVFCDEHAKQLTEHKNDRWLLGHFSDNELPWKRSLLKGYLSQSKKDHGYKAAAAWLKTRLPGTSKAERITEADEMAFLAYAVDTYLRIVGTAIRKYDPNHLFLGTRFHGSALRMPEVFQAAGPHVDVVSVNYYNSWTPSAERLNMWESESGRPILISEFYSKGNDSGLANTGGAGWIVPTQKDRGLFYQNFTLALMKSRVCIGWHWHRYADNDPDDVEADSSNKDSNKGIVSSELEPWTPMLEQMQALNQRVHTIIDQLDKSASAP